MEQREFSNFDQHRPPRSRYYHMRTAIILFFALTLMHCNCDEEISESANFELNFQLKYAGEPLVMLQEYSYADGRKINFQKVSMYLTDIILTDVDDSEVLLKDIELFNFSQSHSTVDNALKGLNYLIEDVREGSYDRISFRIGLDPNLNATEPIDYTSDHPLSRSGEYWDPWGSYIFHKAEGRIDLDDNGSFDSADVFALHIGGDGLDRSFSAEQDIVIANGTTNGIDIEIEMMDYFGDPVFDIDSDNTIHSQSQVAASTELADNFLSAFTIK